MWEYFEKWVWVCREKLGGLDKEIKVGKIQYTAILTFIIHITVKYILISNYITLIKITSYKSYILQALQFIRFTKYRLQVMQVTGHTDYRSYRLQIIQATGLTGYRSYSIVQKLAVRKC